MCKRILLAATALLMVGTASAYKIEGHIQNITDTDSVIVTLFKYSGNNGQGFRTDTIRDGRFSFVGTLPAGEMAMMSVRSSNGKGGHSLWVTDTTTMQISGTADSEWSIVSNEPEQAIEAEQEAIDLSDLDALTESKEGYWKYRDSVWRVSVERLWPVYTKYPNSPAMLNSLKFYVQVSAVPHDKLQQVYDRLTAENRNSLEGEAIAMALDPPHMPQVGEQYADFPATDTAGLAHKLSDYVGTGKYILLDFWSVACGGCYAAFPEMKEIHQKYGDQLQIVGVSIDTDKEMWRGTVKWKELPWTHLSDGKGNYAGAYVKYSIDVLPTYILIAPDGKIIDRWYGGQGTFQERMIGPYLSGIDSKNSSDSKE